MKRNKIYYAIIFILTLLLLFIIFLTILGGRASASAMRLRKTEGSVRITGGNDEKIEAREDMKLYDGYSVRTKSESYAWVDLDSVKLTKLDQLSIAEIEKKGKKLTISVESGNLFFNITEPLEDDESLDIRTSTMGIAIRGTCGWVEVPKDGTMRVFLLEGKVRCETDDGRETIRAGEMAAMAEDGTITVSKLSVADIPGFVMDEIEDDDKLMESVSAAKQESPDSPDAGSGADPAQNPEAEPDQAADQDAQAQQTPEPESVTPPQQAPEPEPAPAANQDFAEQYRDIIGRASSYDYQDPYSGEATGSYKYALYQEGGYTVPTLILEKPGYDHPAYLLFRYDPATGTTSQIGHDRATRFEFPQHAFINDISFNDWHEVTDMSALDAWIN